MAEAAERLQDAQKNLDEAKEYHESATRNLEACQQEMAEAIEAMRRCLPKKPRPVPEPREWS